MNDESPICSWRQDGTHDTENFWKSGGRLGLEQPQQHRQVKLMAIRVQDIFENMKQNCFICEPVGEAPRADFSSASDKWISVQYALSRLHKTRNVSLMVTYTDGNDVLSAEHYFLF